MKLMVVALSAVMLAACGSSCNEDVLKKKMTEITEKMQKATLSGDMSKIMSLSKKFQSISAKAAQSGDMQAACDAADEILEEL